MNKSKIKKNLKEIQQEIDWYNPPKNIATAMIELGKIGFEFSGHGCGIYGEDFGLIYFTSKDKTSYIYVTLSSPVKYSSVCFKNDDNEYGKPIYGKSIPNTIKLAKKLKKRYA